MFELGIVEILLFGAIALIVLGPEKLPHAARVAGAWYARIRRQISSIQNEIEREVSILDTKHKLEEEISHIKNMEKTFKDQVTSFNINFDPYEGSTHAIRTNEFGATYYYLISPTEQVKIAPAAPFLPHIKS